MRVIMVQSMPGKVNAEHKLEQLLAGLRNVVLPRLMQHYHDLHEEASMRTCMSLMRCLVSLQVLICV